MSAEVIEYRFDGTKPVVLSKWKVKEGSRITSKTVILTYIDPEAKNSEEVKLKATVNGTVRQLMVKEGDLVRPNDTVLQLESCKHEVIMKELCAQCGADLRQLSSQNLKEVVASRSFSMVHVVPELRCSLEQAKELDEADEARLLKTRKLVLLVDLDQTLIHTTNENVSPDLKNVHHFQLYGPRSPWYHTKLRPHTQSFLESISKLYELHIFTFGARMYAHKIASILDPDRRLFSHRILSRDECFDATSKTGNLKSLFPRGDSMVCIIDDREDVWNFAPNVVHVKPYVYFRNTGDINSPPSAANSRTVEQNCTIQSEKQSTPEQSITSHLTGHVKTGLQKKNQQVNSNSSEIAAGCCTQSVESSMKTDSKNAADTGKKETEMPDSDEQRSAEVNSVEPDSNACEMKQVNYEATNSDDDDDFLLYLEEILFRIHKAYYELYDEMVKQKSKCIPDLKSVIPYVKRKVLQGVNIVFSGVIPTNLTPEKSSVWLLAKSLGANVSHDIRSGNQSNPTTHLIASKMGTSKLNRAKRNGNIHVVTPNWLFCCGMRWERVDEQLYPLKKGSFESPRKCKKSSKAKELRGIEDAKKVSSSHNSELSNVAHRLHRPEKIAEYKEHNSDDICVTPFQFSIQDLQNMDREVDEACATDGSQDTDDSDCCLALSEIQGEKERSRKRQNSTDTAKLGKLKRYKSLGDPHYSDIVCPHVAGLESELSWSDSSESSTASVCSEDEKLAAAVERELLDS